MKSAKAGDYRIQHIYGGRYQHFQPSASMLAQAEQVMAALPEASCYARVDGIMRDDQLYVMEVELIEPFLYLQPHPQAVNHLVQAIVNQLLNAEQRVIAA